MEENNEYDFSNYYEMISQAERAGEDNYAILSQKKKIIKNNFSLFKDLICKVKISDENKLIQKPIISVDGSNQQIDGAGQIIYVPISIARVYLNSPLFHVKNKNTPYFEEIRIVDDQGHAKVEKNENFVKFYGNYEEDIKKVESSVQNSINFLMLKYESEAINKIADEIDKEQIKKPSIVFLDGPIIDPPIGSLISLIKLRCKALKRLLDHGVYVVGITKRIYQKLFLEYLKRNYQTDKHISKILSNFFGDFDLMNGIFNSEHFNQPLMSKLFNIDDFNLSRNNRTFQEYYLYKNEGIHFKSCYYIKSMGRRVIKVDILVPNGTDDTIYDDIMDCISKLTYPRFSIPLPVYLAHEYANIKEETVLLLKKIILSKTGIKDPLLLITDPPVDMYDIY